MSCPTVRPAKNITDRVAHRVEIIAIVSFVLPGVARLYCMPLRSMAKQVILFLAANPAQTAQLALDQECSAVQRELRLSTNGRDDFDFESRWAVSVDELMRQILELDPTVLHFSGHGTRTGGLLFQDEAGQPQRLAGPALAKVIASTARNLRLVVLNACYSVEQARELVHAVDCVVGMSRAIQDEVARRFAIGFYRALGYRRSVGNAFAAWQRIGKPRPKDGSAWR
jgi:hypothetical protein